MSLLSARSVLVVDDEPGIRLALQANFLRRGWRVETASGVRQALHIAHQTCFDLVVSDVRMPDGDGMEVLQSLRESSPQTAFILLTAFATVPQAVAAMQGGAVDYLTKPCSFQQLEAVVEKVLRQSRSNPAPANDTAAAIVGKSPALMRSIARARAAASTDADVLIEAESGTGKELLARFVHDASNRRLKPFVAVNCAALPESLLESELFGHSRGAFTGATSARQGKFEAADSGTLLLDEIGEMPLNLQPKLLRALQEREFERLGETRSVRTDLRVIAITNVFLGSMVEQGRFRSDLFYRLNVIPLSLPPLRERTEDIPLLANHFAQIFSTKCNRPLVHLEPAFLDRLQTHLWPGNIRELGNFIQRVLSLNPGNVITAANFDSEIAPARNRSQPSAPPAIPPHRSTSPTGVSIRELERSHLEQTLELTQGNRTRAAEMLGISLRTVRNKIRQYDLPPRSYA